MQDPQLPLISTLMEYERRTTGLPTVEKKGAEPLLIVFRKPQGRISCMAEAGVDSTILGGYSAVTAGLSTREMADWSQEVLPQTVPWGLNGWPPKAKK